MRIFSVSAAGYYSVGNAVVIAESNEAAVELVQAESERKYDLTYWPHNAALVGPSAVEYDEPVIVTMREWGMPELPAKGSGKTVTF